MTKLFALALIAIASPVAAHAASDTTAAHADSAAVTKVTAGEMLYSSTGYRLAPVYRVTGDGNPQIVMDGKLVTIPVTTLSDVAGKLTTSLSKKDIAKSM